MVKRKTWEEFRKSGLLWWINTILHTLGWSIVVEVEDNGSISGAYPARVKFRGFSEKDNDEGYKNVSKYMAINSLELEKETRE